MGAGFSLITLFYVSDMEAIPGEEACFGKSRTLGVRGGESEGLLDLSARGGVGRVNLAFAAIQRIPLWEVIHHRRILWYDSASMVMQEIPIVLAPIRFVVMFV